MFVNIDAGKLTAEQLSMMYRECVEHVGCDGCKYLCGNPIKTNECITVCETGMSKTTKDKGGDMDA